VLEHPPSNGQTCRDLQHRKSSMLQSFRSAWRYGYWQQGLSFPVVDKTCCCMLFGRYEKLGINLAMVPIECTCQRSSSSSGHVRFLMTLWCTHDVPTIHGNQLHPVYRLKKCMSFNEIVTMCNIPWK
jgi:hypothetical protein